MNRALWLGGLALLAISIRATPIQTTFARSTVFALPTAGTTRVIPRATAHCETAGLRVSLGQQNGGAGSIFTAIVFRNMSTQTCTLAGYAGVSLVDRLHRQIGRAAQWDSGLIQRITLRPGGAASTTVHTLNPGVGTTNCLSPSTALRIFPPDNRNAVFVPVRLSECLGVLGVKPLVAGTNGA